MPQVTSGLIRVRVRYEELGVSVRFSKYDLGWSEYVPMTLGVSVRVRPREVRISSFGEFG